MNARYHGDAWMVSFGLVNLDLLFAVQAGTMFFFISLSLMWAISSLDKCAMIWGKQQAYEALGYLVSVLSALIFFPFSG